MPVAYSYLRFSTPEQAKGDSLRRQLAASEAYAAEHGLTLDTSLRDEGVSGFRGRNRSDNAALGNFLRRIEAGDVPEGAYFLVESLDRLSRQTISQALATLQAIVQAGVIVVTMSDRRQYDRAAMDDLMSLMWALMQMSRAHEESARKSDLVGKAWATKHALALKTGAALTPRCPGWLSVDGPVRGGRARYVVNEARASVIREIFSLAIDGLGTDAIAGRLNARGESPWGEGARKGTCWHASYIQKILAGRAVLGDYEPPGKTPIPKLFPPVIDDETYYRARAAASERRLTGEGRSRGGVGSYRNVFSGVATCAVCGGGMHYVDRGTRSSGPVLQCGASRLRACDNRRPYDYPQFERFIVTSLPHVMSAAERSLASDASSRLAIATSAVSSAHAKLADVQSRMDSVVAAVEAGAGAALAGRLIALTAELDAAKAAVAEAEVRARAETDDSRTADLGMLARRLRDPDARPAVAATIRRTVASLTCDRDGNVRLTTVNGGTGAGKIRPHPAARANPGQFIDGVRRRGRPAKTVIHQAT